GLFKLAMIGGVALIVIGPDKLPTVARMAGSLYGRAQRYINDVKKEVSSQIALEELLKLEKDAHEASINFGKSIAQGLAGIEESLQPDLANFDAQRSVPSAEQIALKARDFRKKKLIQHSEIPGWYRNKNAGRYGGKAGIISCAARVARYRAGKY
ncbi:MAG: Sec-independent protein translocase subunit TatA/TatB, partial [Burkholderiaceae bacterium]